MSVLSKLVTNDDVVEFSSNYNPTTSSLLDQVFPNEKTQNLKLSYLQARKNQYTQMAEVHALDTESKIASREKLSEVELKKLLIKEKIQLNEEWAELADSLKDNSMVYNLIFDDMGNMSDRVKTRTLVMKGELLSTGKVTVKENNLDITIDYKVPTDNFTTLDWSASTKDILADIKNMVDAAAAKGYKVTRGVTSSKIISTLQMDASVRGAIFGANAARIPTLDELNAFIYSMYKIRLVAFDDMYRYEKADGTKVTARYIPENKIVLFGGDVTDTLGKGFYGVTPEERNARLNVQQSKNIYIMNTIWDTADPVGTWTKASAMFIPVLADPDNLFVATVTLA